MAITKKDWQIINQALAQYEAMCVDDDDGAGHFHKKRFGNVEKTIDATRIRVTQLMLKKGIPL